MIIKEFSILKYNFSKFVSDAFMADDLSRLHEIRKDLLPKEKLKFENESKTNFHELFYKQLNAGQLKELESCYYNFIKNEILINFTNDILYQYMPSFRVHLPNNQAIHKWHYDADEDHRHPDWEINIFIPLTNAFGTQTIWIESVPGLQDYKPINIKYGEYAIFNGNKCMHGNKENVTQQTRVSFDFRILPINKYNNNAKQSVTTGKKFVEGEYYRRMSCSKP